MLDVRPGGPFSRSGTIRSSRIAEVLCRGGETGAALTVLVCCMHEERYTPIHHPLGSVAPALVRVY